MRVLAKLALPKTVLHRVRDRPLLVDTVEKELVEKAQPVRQPRLSLRGYLGGGCESGAGQWPPPICVPPRHTKVFIAVAAAVCRSA